MSEVYFLAQKHAVIHQNDLSVMNNEGVMCFLMICWPVLKIRHF